MSRHRLAASMLLLAICALAFAVESPSRDSAYRYSDVFTVNADGSGLRNLTRKYLGRDDYPALSPDGRTLVFERERIAGGYGWSGLALMPSRGGRGRDLIRIPDGNAWRPAWSRDGAFVAFTGCYDPCNVRGVGVVRRDGSGLKWIPDASDPTWLSGRRIAFLTEFDGQRAQAIGVTKADGTGRSIVARTSDVAASMFFRPSASPDGTTIAFSAYGPTYLRWPLYVVNVNRGSAPRLIAPSGSDATWAPSGRRLAFYDSNSLWTVRVDGSRLRRLWRPITDFPGLPSWSPDGMRMAFVASRYVKTLNTKVCNLVVMNLRRRSFTVVARRVEWAICWRHPVWSQDSRRLYYVDLPGS